jgi:DNA-binding transcriptional LysR family regulator
MKFNSEIEINSNEAIIEAVQAGLGIGFVSKHTVKLELERQKSWWWWQLKSLNVQSQDLRFVRYLPLIVPTWQSLSNKFDRISCQYAWERLFCL